MGPQPTTGEAGEEYRTSPDRALRDLKERIRQGAPMRWADQTNDGEPDVMGEPVVTEPQETLKTETSSARREATTRRSPEYERRETRVDRRGDDWRESSRDSYWRDRDRDRAPPRRVFDPQTGESHPLPYESKDHYIITHKASEPPTFRGYDITEYLEKWELHASRSQWSEEEIIENFLFNVDPSLDKEVKEARPKDGKWTTYKKNLIELYKLEDNKYSIKDLETMTQDEDESVRAFGKRFQKISDVLMKKGKISEAERYTIFIRHLSKGRQKSILRDLPRDKLDFPEVLKLAIKAEANDYKDLVWRGMRRPARGSIARSADDRPSTPRNSCVYCRGHDHIKRDCPDLKRAIDEGLVVLDDRKYVKWTNDLGDVSMFPSMKENVEARRVKPSKEKEPIRSPSIKITFEGDMATTPIRVATTKSARGSTSRKTDTDYVMAEKDGHRIDGEEVIFSSRKRGVKKFLMKSSLDEIDTVEPLRLTLQQPMQCSILEYLATSKPAHDELQMITRKTRIPLSEEVQVAPKADAPTVAVSEVTARADCMATVLLDGMEGVPPDKFYILGSETVEAILNDGAVLDAVIDNGSEAVITDEDLAE
ncbi:hypothetical protein CBR_g12781 [Chara braunii]|uniref:Retrotransposon gag domain-containing protein n=1 Tax=Chara braunii TaxID=69332 RepID=A0A388KSL4_CHABU|nr:hypothetical protein CBR_g12781 [Chara braunii]|eukprot:GBG73065.1 hypothetical protein CBR_g12781 [Chara braunii]